MSDLWVEKLRCFNPLTGKRDGGYCVWEGQGKCLYCQAADEIERLREQNKYLLDVANSIAPRIKETEDRLTEAERLLATCCGAVNDALQDMIDEYFADRETDDV